MNRPEAFERIWRREGDPAFGTHLFPVRFIGEPVNPGEAHEAARVIDTIPVGQFDVVVTRMSGLFVRVPDEIQRSAQADAPFDTDKSKARKDFAARFVQALNLLICELTLLEVISEPASPLHIAPGIVTEQYAAIVSGSGGRESYYERTVGPTTLLTPPGHGLTWLPVIDAAAVRKAQPIERSLRLAAVAETLPGFVASAYSLYSRHMLAEALLDAWIVVEQVVNHLWSTKYMTRAVDGAHRKRLRDDRTYTAAVKIEILFSHGLINPFAYQEFQTARKNRNDLAHGAKVSERTAREAMVGMREAIELVTGETPPWPLVVEGIS